jgi:microcystin-dependent protein
MADPFVAEIRIFGFNFAPKGWAFCDGQLLPIWQNTALFSLVGTYYGGDGKSTFGLPNLMERFAVGAGEGPGLTPRQLGETGGTATVALTTAQMPVHYHALAATDSADATSPQDASLATTANGSAAYRRPGVVAMMAGNSLTPTGQSIPHENRQPTLALSYCIALQGIYPQRP